VYHIRDRFRSENSTIFIVKSNLETGKSVSDTRRGCGVNFRFWFIFMIRLEKFLILNSSAMEYDFSMRAVRRRIF